MAGFDPHHSQLVTVSSERTKYLVEGQMVSLVVTSLECIQLHRICEESVFFETRYFVTVDSY